MMANLSQIKDINLDHIKDWDFLLKTPAGRSLYHNRPLDVIAYVSFDGSNADIHYNRVGTDNTSISFCEKINVGRY